MGMSSQLPRSVVQAGTLSQNTMTWNPDKLKEPAFIKQEVLSPQPQMTTINYQDLPNMSNIQVPTTQIDVEHPAHDDKLTQNSSSDFIDLSQKKKLEQPLNQLPHIDLGLTEEKARNITELTDEAALNLLVEINRGSQVLMQVEREKVKDPYAALDDVMDVIKEEGSSVSVALLV